MCSSQTSKRGVEHEHDRDNENRNHDDERSPIADNVGKKDPKKLTEVSSCGRKICGKWIWFINEQEIECCVEGKKKEQNAKMIPCGKRAAFWVGERGADKDENKRDEKSVKAEKLRKACVDPCAEASCSLKK